MIELSETGILATSDHQTTGRAQQRTCLLVLGMHRSGTSALTRVLSLLGAALPKNLLGAGVGNETGHWEPKRLVDLHDEMLTEAGSSWDDWRRLDLAAQLPDGRLDHYKQRIRQLIEEEYGNEPLFVIKEPRICRFVPLYREVLAQIDIDVRPILIVRNPLEVAASLSARNEMAPEQSQLYWLRHVLEAEASTRDIPRAFASYAALLADWRTALPPIAAQLRLIWPREPQSVASEIDAFLSSSHRHHTISVGDLNDDPALSRWVQHANTAIMRLLEDPASSLSELDKLGGEFDAAAALFGPALTAERMAREQSIAAHKADSGRLRAEIDAERTTLEQLAAAHKAEEERLRAEIEAERAAREQLAAAHKAEEERLRAEIEAERAAREQLAAAHRAEEERLRAEIEAERAAREQLAATYKAEEERLHAEIDAERFRSESLSKESAKLDRNLRQQAAELDLLGVKLDILRSASSRSTERATQLEAELRLFQKSRSWRITKPLRTATTLVRRARLVPLTRLPAAVAAYATSRLLPAASTSRDNNRSSDRDSIDNWSRGVLIATPPHTLHYASILAAEINALGFVAVVEGTILRASDYQHLIVFCPNVFDDIPDDYIAIQMEQTINSRWLTHEYVEKLGRARAVIDYSVDNIAFFRDLGLPLNRSFYVPVPSKNIDTSNDTNASNHVKKIQVLFYGDANCHRRRHMIEALREHFQLKVINNVFGPELWKELKSAKVVVNIHYYEGALLETARLSECMSFGVPVVSERAVDEATCREFEKGVLFVDTGDVSALVEGVRRVLQDENLRASLILGAHSIADERYNIFSYFIRRALYALNMIGIEDTLAAFRLPKNAETLCLTLPETPARTTAFQRRNRPEFSVVHGLRHRLNWKGCALSYMAIMAKALECGLDELLICEDDTVFSAGVPGKIRGCS